MTNPSCNTVWDGYLNDRESFSKSALKREKITRKQYDLLLRRVMREHRIVAKAIDKLGFFKMAEFTRTVSERINKKRIRTRSRSKKEREY